VQPVYVIVQYTFPAPEPSLASAKAVADIKKDLGLIKGFKVFVRPIVCDLSNGRCQVCLARRAAGYSEQLRSGCEPPYAWAASMLTHCSGGHR